MDDSPGGCCGCCPSLYTALAVESSSEAEEPSRPLPSLQLPADADHSRSPETPSPLVSLGAFVLSADYDAEREYVRHYAVGGYDTECLVQHQQSQSGRFVMRDNSFNKSVVLQNRAILDAAVTGESAVSPRELTRCLEHLALKIRLEQDLEKRVTLIGEYEQYKDALDRNNSEDAERAHYFLGDARNQRLELEARLGYYRKAVQFTNELKQKEVLRNEYHDFCNQLMRIAS
jgi:hypothetical protein